MKFSKLFFIFAVLVESLYSASTKDFVNLRSEPNAKSQIVNVIQKNSPVTIIEEFSTWIEIKITSGESVGKIGWVYSPLIKDGIVLGEGCSLRSDAKTSSTPVCFLKAGTTYSVVSKKYTWYKVSVKQFEQDFTGWIFESNLNLK
jgi:uncharacterized protein YgiM (DUF1202 family)